MPEETEQKTEEMEKLDIYPNLMAAYAINLGKALVFVAALVGAFYFVEYIVGTNPFIDILDTLGIPLVWANRAIIVAIGIYFALTFFDTLSLTSYELIFEGDTLSYSYGSFIKVMKSTKMSNMIRANFNEYKPLKLGEMTVELTGTEEKVLKVRFVGSVREKCGLVNKLIELKKYESYDVRDKSAE
jgi:hypothetical protein